MEPDDKKVTNLTEPGSAEKRPVLALRRLWKAEIFYAVALLAFGMLALLAHWYSRFSWDATLQHWILDLQGPGFGEFMRLVSIPGNGPIPHILTVLTALLFLSLRLRSEAFSILMSAAGSGLVNTTLKILVGRPRPLVESGSISFSGNSFPSGHVTFFVCYFGFLFFVAYALLPRGSLTRRLVLLISLLPILLIGISRVYLTAHWPSDTLGSYLFGGVWLAFSLDMYRRWKARQS
ncbi:MAG TPA: phosphatase PAP2 family protein [Pyrinomonadaceae bacterium]|nr:phosphatase PAP2 family protein [Pyrinomonadaceae bacterium]